MICAEIYFPRVEQDFDAYEAFRIRQKTVSAETVLLTQESANVECKGTAVVDAALPSGSCEFIAVRSPKKHMKYSFKIRAEHFDAKPCLRFCSRAHVHVNEETGVGLPGRAVPTPHFHRVDSRGIIFAYKNSALEDTEESDKIVGDPQLGANLFCQETNLVSPSGGTVALKIMTAELLLSSNDPLDGATFPL